MLAEQFKKKRYEDGFVEGYAKEVANARADRQGLGQADRNKKNEVWKKLKKEAEEEARRLLRRRQFCREEPGSIFISDGFLRKRYEAGQAAQQKKWEAWYARLMEAKAKGQPFDEPHPTLEKRR